jgi:flagellar FliJ protein
MKKFAYRLEPLLKMKAHIEKERQKDHAVARGKALEQKRSLEKIDAERAGTLDRQRDEMSGKMSVAELLIYSRYLLKLKKDTLTGGEMLKVLERNVEAKRRALVEATKQKKVYEKLKERQQKRHQQMVQAQETKEADEIAIMSYQQQQRARRKNDK